MLYESLDNDLPIDVEACLGRTTALRGLAYFHAGHVEHMEVTEPFGFTGQIRGSQRRPYTATLYLEPMKAGWVLSGSECTCPVAFGCKHVAALLYAAMQPDDDADDAFEAYDEDLFVRGNSHELAQIEEPLTPLAWLTNVADALASPMVVNVDYSVQHWVYLLTADDDDATPVTKLSLLALRGRRLKSGQYGAMNAGHLDHQQNYSRYPDDMEVLQGILQLHSARATLFYEPLVTWPLPVCGPRSGHVLRAAIATGRAYGDHVETTPLTWGPDRLAHLAWQRQSDGAQCLHTTLPSGCQVLFTEPLCYLDRDIGSCGYLHLPVPQEILEQLGHAPPVSLDDVDAFRAALPAALADTLPLPRSLPLIERVLEPKPQLFLRKPEGVEQPLRARLAFKYDDAALEVAADGTVYREEGDVLVRVCRQPELERSHEEALRALGAESEAEPTVYTLEREGTTQALYAARRRLATLESAGWTIHSEEPLTNRIIDIDTPWDIAVAEDEEAGAMWFSLDMGIDIDGKRQQLVPILAAAIRQPHLGVDPSSLQKSTQERVYIPLNEHVTVALPRPRLLRIMSILYELYADNARLGALQAAEILDLVDAGEATLQGRANILRIAKRLRACEGVPTCTPPKGLLATLRPYQMQGLSWLQFLRDFNLAGILADDMGLGKTLQALAHILTEKEAGRLRVPALVVVPTSLLFNWQDEAARFAPTLVIKTIYGADRDPLSNPEASDVLLTTYGTLLRDIDALEKIRFSLVVLDESQAIKNPTGKLHKAVLKLHGEHRLCMTGTPIENNLLELWAQFRFLCPGLLSDTATFRATFRGPIEKDKDPHVRGRLHALIRPFVLRRTKEVVAKELPPKTEVVRRIHIEGAQRDLYEAVRAAVSDRVLREVKQKGLARASVAILDALLKLRQACCDPRLMRLTAAAKVRDSAKLEHLVELVEQLKDEGRRMLIFSQFTSMLDLIGDELDAREVSWTSLTGETRNRREVVEEFQGGDVDVMLISLKAGGSGLNLTRADTVIHYDPWWNPAAEKQATDRVHRIGQDRSVFVYKLIVAQSVEEKILALQERKRTIADALFGDGKLSTLFTQDDLRSLLAPMGG